MAASDPLAAPDTDAMLATLAAGIDAELATQMQTCVHCGLCAETCHYFLTSDDTRGIPAYKAGLVTSVFARHHTAAGRLLPALGGAKRLDAPMVAEWIDALYGRCTLCGRCTINCTMGISLERIIRAGRSALAAAGLVPSELQATVERAVHSGNNMGITTEEWLETVDWLQDELRGETGDPKAAMPIDRADQDVLYAINPREAKFYPLSLLAAGKVFHAAGARWTLASDAYDVTNYALFSGDDEAGALIARRLQDTAKRLGAKRIVLGECGHGFNANRWEGVEWRASRDDVPMISILDVLAGFLQAGSIRVDPARNSRRHTLHDPCNLVRLGGKSAPQRYVLSRVVSEFVEMTPTREENFCCGGGGGQLSMTRFADRRLAAGRVKADQIRATGAAVVVAPCHNCIDQLAELNRHYGLEVDVRTVTETAADALVLGPEALPTPPSPAS
jgi:Fe-S oxidoreductase